MRIARLGASFLVVLAAIAGAACGDDDDAATPTDAPATSAAATTEPSADAFPASVEHALGTTVVEDEPQRVVTVGVTEQDFVMALGVTPIGVTEWYGEQPFATWPWAQDELGDAEPTVLFNTDGLDFEGIAALKPDLIIGTNAGLDEEAYGKLTAIAPTVAHPKDAPLYFSPWDDQFRLIGTALGKDAQTTAIIDDIDAQFAAARQAHPEFAGKMAIFLQNAIHDGSAIAYQKGLSTDFLTDLGFDIPSELDAFATEGQAYIPLEQLSILDAGDVLLWATEAPTDRTALEQQPLYNALAAVKDGRLVFTDGVTAGAIYFTSPLSLPFVLEQLVPALAETVAGNGPSTIDATAG
jgi:iron complex transport system substrate-binding protein